MEIELTNGGLEWVSGVPTTLYNISLKTDGTTYTTATITASESAIVKLTTKEGATVEAATEVVRYTTITAGASDEVFTTTAKDVGSFYSEAVSVTAVSAVMYNATFA